MTSRKTSADGLAALRKDEGAIDGLYNDPSGYATFGVGHLVHPRDKWGSFLLAAARTRPEWVNKLGRTLGVTYLPRSAVGWGDFAQLRQRAAELGMPIVARRRYKREGAALKSAEQAAAKATAEACVKTEADLLAETVDQVLANDLGQFERAVNTKVTHDRLTQEEFDALVSLAFNIGVANFAASTVLRRVNDGRYRAGDAVTREAAIKGIADAFAMWNKSGGVVLPGLVHRRDAEAERFLRGARKELAALRMRTSTFEIPRLQRP